MWLAVDRARERLACSPEPRWPRFYAHYPHSTPGTYLVGRSLEVRAADARRLLARSRREPAQ
jgi:hypothetical protein